MRGLALLFLAGCNAILGIETTRVGGDGGGPADARVPAIDADNRPLPIDFGDGGDGPLVVGASQILYTDDVRTSLSASPTNGNPTLVVAATAGFDPGDEVVVLQMLGTGQGSYETAIVDSAPTDSELVLTVPLTRSFQAATRTQVAQVIRVPHYTEVTIQADGTLTGHPFDGVTGGVVFFRASGTLSIEADGSLSAGDLGFAGGGTSVGGAGGPAGVGSYGGVGVCASCGNGATDVGGSGTDLGGGGAGGAGGVQNAECFGGSGGDGGLATAASPRTGGQPAPDPGGGAGGSMDVGTVNHGGGGGSNLSGGRMSLLLGGGGGGGGGGAGGLGGGGGGGGGAGIVDNDPCGMGDTGGSGTLGSGGGMGGAGGRGGGLLIVAANRIEVASGATAGKSFEAAGGQGDSGFQGGPGGDGGRGGNAHNQGGGGGGGNGGTGAAGGSGGGGGAGGAIYLMADTLELRDGVVSALGGDEGQSGAGGGGGDAGPIGTTACGCGPCCPIPAENGMPGAPGATGSAGEPGLIGLEGPIFIDFITSLSGTTTPGAKAMQVSR